MEKARSELAESEQLKSFDVLSSVNLYKYDLQTFGHILPETRQRVYDEELSYIAEGINRPNYKEFVLQSAGGQLVYFHEGAWKPYISTLVTGLETAKAEASSDYRKNFEVARRAEDLKRGYLIQNLEQGEKIVWHYNFPHEQLVLYGQELLGDMGFQSKRKMGYLCEAEKTAEGAVIIRHQSVDNSDNEAFAAALELGSCGESIDDMRSAYDDVLNQKHGGQHFAGRRVTEVIPEENAWCLIEKHRGLIDDYLMKQIEFLARQNIPIHELESAKKRLTYGVWAAIKERIDGDVWTVRAETYQRTDIYQEVLSAYSALAAKGEVLFGCGGSISGDEALTAASSKDVFERIFGKKMSCPFCGTTQYGDPCSPNQFCSQCKAEVVNGRVKSEGNGGKKNIKIRRTPGFFEVISIELNRYEHQRKQKDKLKKAA